MTTSFYVPPSLIQGNRLQLPEDEARHAVRVLRKRAGDEIAVVDGAGSWHRVRLDHTGKDRAAGTILETRQGVGEPSYHLTVGLGLLKNRNRFETFLEKAVELGVRRIIPLHTNRTEKESLKERRAENILVAAMKQCGRSRLPELTDPMALPTALNASECDQVLICHGRAPAERSLHRVVAEVSGDARILVLVGPEGGFSEEEVRSVQAKGGIPVLLGRRRLRAETAAVVAAAAVQLMVGELG